MKKLIAISVVFVLLASAAFAADVYFGAWGRGVFVPVKAFVDGNDSDGGYTYAGTEVEWDAHPNFALYFAIGGDNIGFVSNWDFSASDMNGQGRDGTLFTWWKPLDQFQLDIGWSRWDELRGPDIFESYSSYATAGDYPDFIFHRFSTADWWTADWEEGARKPGAILRITPVDNLFIGAAILTGPGVDYIGSKSDGDIPATNNDLEAVFGQSQYAFGYNIEGIGLVRAGYFGTSSGVGPKLAQLAFKLTAVEGLMVDLGFGYSLDKDLADAKHNNMQIGLVANYIADAFGVIFGFQGVLGGDKDVVAWDGSHPGVTTLGFALNPEFFLDFANIGLGFYMNAALLDEVETSMGFSAYILKSVSGGSIKAGVAAAITPNGDKNDILLQIPIEITYSIW